MAARGYSRVLFQTIKSLDNLNDQIVQFIFTPKSSELEVENDLSPQDRETLKSSMALMRRLLIDAQSKFRKMVEDNKRLASRIDGSIHAANQEVNALRAELHDTNRKLCEISDPSEQITPYNDLNNACPKRSISDAEKIMQLQDDNSKLQLQVQQLYKNRFNDEEMLSHLKEDKTKLEQELHSVKNQRSNQDIEEILKLQKAKAKLQEQLNNMEVQRPNSQNLEEVLNLKEENCKLQKEMIKLKSDLEDLRKTKIVNSDDSKVNELKLDLIQCKQELNRAKEALHAMKADRKRLKAEKVDLLSQMKQLYSTLEDKESELREFIRNYEQRMKESDDSIKQLATEKDESEREKWEILKRARDAAERAVSLRSELDNKEKLLLKLQAEAAEANEKLNNSQQYRSRSSPQFLLPTPPGSSPHTPVSSSENLKSMSALSNSSEDIFSGSSPNSLSSSDPKKKKKRNSVSTFSKMFGGKSRTRRSIAVSDSKILEEQEESLMPRNHTLNEENYQEKLHVSNLAKNTPIAQWRANQVLAWLEIEMSMPLYGKLCAENIKSGKVLLGLSDSELESALGINNHTHRRKLRLAIEEYREPSICKFPKASTIDHTWVAHKWVHDIGMPQYSPVFETNLMDGRLLNALSKKEMEKYLGIHRKFHHISLLHAVELLRRVDFDKEVLVERRSQCESTDEDPLVWTNKRLIKWVQDIDLHEYAGNLRESGVHGALMILEPTFTSETMAAALGIPPSKQYIRRHLTTELNGLIKPARAKISKKSNLDAKKSKTSGGSLGRSFNRSFRNTSMEEEGSKKRISFRGSLGRALGRKVKQDLGVSFDSATNNRPRSAEVEHTDV